MDLILLLKSFLILFVIMDPVGNIPIFIAITKDFSDEERKKAFNQAVIVAAVLLLIFAFLGRLILNFLGITIDSFIIAGGFLLLVTSIDLLMGKERKYKKEGIGGVPMGTPLLAGPGAITTVMIIIQEFGVFSTIFSIFGAIIITKLILDQSNRIYRLLGENGSEVLSRVVGVLVAAIAIEFIRKGVFGLIGI